MTKTEPTPAASPDDLLKAAVAGGAAPKSKPEPAAGLAGGPAARAAAILARVRAPARASLARVRPDARLLGASAAALALGLGLGVGLAGLSRPKAAPGDGLAGLRKAVDSGRAEAARAGGDIAQIHQILADLRAGADAARRDAVSRHAALTERLAQGDRAVAAKVAALTERLDQAEREQGARVAALAAQIERRGAVAAAKTDGIRADAARVEAAKPEPAQTGSLAETKSAEGRAPDPRAPEVRQAEAKPADPKSAETKALEARAVEARTAEAKVPDAKPRAAAPDRPPVIDGWALRDVYDGAAILENRRRRLVEVAPGDVLPGVGRVEGVERRGREWVVVTRQGLITPQAW